MAAPARFPSGVTNAAPIDPMGMMGTVDQSRFHEYFNDFNAYTAGNWTITKTEAGAGNAAALITNADGGVLLATNDDALADNQFFQLVGEGFLFEPGKKLWFKARVKLSDASNSAFVIGLQVTDTTPLVVTDGVYFITASGATTVDFVVKGASTATTVSAIASMVTNTYAELAFYYDGVSEVQYFFNGVKRGTAVSTNVPVVQTVCLSFGLQNGTSGAKSMSIDYIYAAKERA